MQHRLLGLVVIVALLGSAPFAWADDAFDRDVAPILQKHCTECHSEDDPEAKLRLSTRDGLLYGSASGRILIPGQAKESLLLRLLSAGSKPHMPPEGQLSDAEIASVTRWVDQLSADALPKREAAGSSDHWAYKPLTKPDPPQVNNTAWVRNPIDRFILAKLEAAGLAPAPEADAATLCRRLYFDLIGLPPTPDEMQAFVQDPSVQAYAELVDKLLASPHYGERWGRHWLDLARYADSSGYQNDVDRPYAWKYRDYVIESFNADKPYAQFIAEQLAGDELAPDDREAWIATGFCRCGPTNDDNMGEGTAKEKYRLDLLDDVISTTSAVFLGQTIGCARCHDHKLDPIAQTEYYRMLAIFDPTQRVDVALDEEGAPTVVTPLTQKGKFAKDKNPPKWSIMAMTDTAGSPRTTHLLWRGDVLNRGPAVEPGVPAVMAIEPLKISTSPGDTKTTGRRKALAEWIASPRNPLTWRVVANRIWQHHLGDGIVATPSNFGRSGAPPTHSELLDYLAQEMLASEGRWKSLHRLIVTSATYRQAGPAKGEARNKANQIDPENRLLSRAPQRRLEAEVLRDAVLSVAGKLNDHVGGPGVKPRIRPELLVASMRNQWPVVEREGPEHWRRSVYIYVKRQLPFPLLELFDQPNSQQTCDRRDENVVPTQALVLMNDEFMAEQAAHFADRILLAAGDDPAEQIAHAVQIAFGRQAANNEVKETVAFLRERAKAYLGAKQDDSAASRSALIDFCHVLLNSNEFAYID
jgi:hypothetical protein